MTPYEQEDDIEDPPIEAIVGGVQGSAGADELAQHLLSGINLVCTLSVLLAEADEDEFRAVNGRLLAFREMVKALPSTPRARPRMGFKPRAKKRGKK